MSLQIKEILKKKGVSVQELADRMGINRVSLSYQINGNPTLETLTKIAEHIGVDISELFSNPSKEELTALIEYKGDMYKANTINELEAIIEKIKKPS